MADEITNESYQDHQTAEVDTSINSDLVDTRGEGDTLADQ